MRTIRKLDRSHLEDYHRITVNAYPQGKDLSPEGVRAYFEEVGALMDKDREVHFFGLFEGEDLRGVMRVFDFQVNLFGRVQPMAGLGFLAVDLAHKKRKIARDLIDYFEAHALKRGIPLAVLLPFRPDFYKTMGYGLGGKYSFYEVPPSRLPSYGGGGQVLEVDKSDLAGVLACQRRLVEKTHGLAYKLEGEVRDWVDDEDLKIFAHYWEGEICAYLAFSFEPGPSGNYFDNDLKVREMAYLDPDSFLALMGFLRTQADQVKRVIIGTGDPYFHLALDDPTRPGGAYEDFGLLEANSQYVGAMYKVLDVHQALGAYDYRDFNGADLSLSLLIEDELAGQTQEVNLVLEGGRASLVQERQKLTIGIKLADLSSLYMGATTPSALYRLGRLGLDDEGALADLDRAFYLPRPPVFNSDF